LSFWWLPGILCLMAASLQALSTSLLVSNFSLEHVSGTMLKQSLPNAWSWIFYPMVFFFSWSFTFFSLLIASYMIVWGKRLNSFFMNSFNTLIEKTFHSPSLSHQLIRNIRIYF
jgi:hypothetical protein